MCHGGFTKKGMYHKIDLIWVALLLSHLKLVIASVAWQSRTMQGRSAGRGLPRYARNDARRGMLKERNIEYPSPQKYETCAADFERAAGCAAEFTGVF